MASLGNTTRPAYVYDAETDTWCPIGVGVHTHGEISASIVDAKGDLIVGTAADTVQRRAVGSDGSYLVADSTQTTGLNWAGPSNIAGKNFLINGGFDIWQRGTSFTSDINKYTADRWMIYRNQVTSTISRQATGDNTNLPFIQYCMRFQRNSGSTSTATSYISQSMETANSIPLAGKTVTYSFWARKGADFSAASSQVSIRIATGTGIDQNVITATYTGLVNALDAVATVTTSWQRFSYTTTLASNITQINPYFQWDSVGTAGTNDYLEITGVQLEIGSSATPFSRAGGTIQGELAACQRYYWRTQNPGQFTAHGSGFVLSSTEAVNIVTFPVTMRVIPTSVEYSTLRIVDVALSPYVVTALALGNSSASIGYITATSTGMTTSRFCILQNNNSASGYIALNAEL